MLVNSQSEETELIQKRPLKEDIFNVLHEKIISGTYKPGDWLRQEDIATQLGVSMTPVREGLDLLVYEALFRNPEMLADSMATTHQEHIAIVDALRERDGDKAVQKSIEHVMESGKWLEEYQDIPGQLLREKEEQVSPLMKK